MSKRDIATKDGAIDSDSLCTPRLILEPVYEIFQGPVDTDPCSNPHSIVKARQSFHEHGLALPWSYNRRAAKTWQNHPYSINLPWQVKACFEMRIGNVSELLVLCMAAPSTYWWSGFMVAPRVNPRVIFTERLKFLGPDGRPMKDTARFDTALIYYPQRRAQVGKFDRLFSHVTRWATWGR